MPTPSDNQSSEDRFLWQRNVRDIYKSVPTEDIKEDLRKKALPCAVRAQNLEHDMNIGCIMRTANAFGVFDFHYFGARKWDRRGAMGVRHYMNVHHHRTLDEVKSLKAKYRFVGLENNLTRGSVDIRSYQYAKNTFFIIGEEQRGITNDLLDLCDDLIEIPIRGSVRSFNAATAASIALFDYVSKTQ